MGVRRNSGHLDLTGVERSYLLELIDADSNLPKEARREAKALLDDATREDAGEPGVRQRVLSRLVERTASAQLLPRGPSLSLPLNTRLARLITIRDLTYHLAPSIPLFGDDEGCSVLKEWIQTGTFEPAELLRKPIKFRGFAGVVWCTLHRSTLDLSLQDLESALSLSCREEIVLVSYQLTGGTVHIPTVLDALFDPSFVPKPKGTTNPRAWDWQRKRWGLPEFVHLGDIPLQKLAFHYLGSSKGTVPLYDLNHLTRPRGDDARQIIVPELISTDDRLIQALRANPSLMYDIGTRDFERAVAEIIRDEGWEVELTPVSKDGGFDALAKKETAVGPILCLIEAKRYRRDRPIGVELVRSLYGTLVHEGASTALMVTTSRFTQGAREFEGHHKHKIALRDHSDIVKWLSRYGQNRRHLQSRV